MKEIAIVGSLARARLTAAVNRLVAAASSRSALAASLLATAGPGPGAGPAPAVVGPENGTLLVVGGAMQSAEIYEAFIELAGGPDAHLVMIPTAGGQAEYDDRYGGLNAWRAHGARNMTVLHTTDPEVADTEAFVEPLRTADAVFFFGGRQWRLVDAYGGTRTEEEIRERAGPGRRHRRHVGGRLHPGIVPGAR
jgi:hypothetical protein